MSEAITRSYALNSSYDQMYYVGIIEAMVKVSAEEKKEKTKEHLIDEVKTFIKIIHASIY